MSRENLQYCTLIIIQLGKMAFTLHTPRDLHGQRKILTLYTLLIIVTLLLLWFMHLCPRYVWCRKRGDWPCNRIRLVDGTAFSSATLKLNIRNDFANDLM